MEEIVWVNGQSDFDFDYLLNLTNEEFVDFVAKSIAEFEKVISTSITVKVQNDDQVKVFVVGNDIVHIHVFSKMLKGRRSYFLNKHDIDWVWHVMNGEI